MSFVKRALFYFFLVVAYLASTIPVGIGLYSIKSYLGIDIIKHGGLHAFSACVEKQLGNGPSKTAVSAK